MFPRLPGRVSVALAVGLWATGFGLRLSASSHSDAPLIKQDPQVDLTDVYAFVGTRFDDPAQRVLNVLACVRPFADAGGGAAQGIFAEDARYSIHLTHPVTGATIDRYDFRFSLVDGRVKNPDTVLSYGLGTELGAITSVGDARQNVTQAYSVARNGVVLGTALKVPPPNVGVRTTPGYNDSVTGKAVSGATRVDELDPLTRQGIHGLSSGEVVFAGPRDDGFYADTPGLYDLLDPRLIADRDGNPQTGGLGQDGGGTDGHKGYNVLTYGIQIPIDALVTSAYADPLFGPGAVGVGVYASVSLPRVTLRRTDAPPVSSGPWVQVSRRGNPLFNEWFVALRDKDRYRRTSPTGDEPLRKYAQAPELARLINLIWFGDSSGNSPLPPTNLVLPNVYIPDVIRVNTTTDPVRLPGRSGFSRLGWLGEDYAPGGNLQASGGWPNGRRIGDDVVDIVLTALSLFTVGLGDNVNANDQIYHQVFPYLATPHAGTAVDMRQSPD